MSSTKIINVLKDDSFQEIMDLFKSTSADEVIFVLPKSAKAFKKEDQFASLKEESKTLGKSVSFLCSNPDLNDLAKKYKFDVLLARSPVTKKVSKGSKQIASSDSGSIDVVNEIEDFYAEPALSADSISTTVSPEEENEDTGLELEEGNNGRRFDDIFVPEKEDKHSVKVSGSREKAVPVEVNYADLEEEPLQHRALQEIKTVWGTQPARLDKNAEEKKPILAGWFKRSTKSSPNFASKAVSDRSSRPRRPAHRTGLITLACLAIVVLGVVVFITTGKAQVTIKPTSQNLDLNLNMFASDSIATISLANLSVPGQLFNIQKTVSQDFPATGHVDVAQKSRGTITVYNELSSDQPLIATTRFESADHHIFHTLTSITVPAGKTVSGKLVPGSKDVQVIADKAGAEYNVPVGLFTIPAFKEKGDTTKYQKVYGQSTSEFRGGTSGQSVVATDSDLEAAKQALTSQLTTSVQSELQAQINDLKIIDSNQVVVGGPISTNPVDATASTFKASLTGSIKTVGFREADIKSLVVQYIDTQKNMVALPDKLTITYSNIHWDDTKNGLAFTVHVSTPGYSKIDKKKITSDLLGKNDADMRAYLGSIGGVASAHVSLSPFWVRSIPKSQDKVTVDISY